MLPVHIGDAVLNVVEAALDLIHQFQHLSLLLRGHIRILPKFPETPLDIRLVNVKIVAGLQDMVLLLYRRLHVAVQMLLQQILIILLLQQAFKKCIHVVKHVLQSLVQLLRVDQGRLQHGQAFPPIIFIGKEGGVHILDVNLRLLHLFVDQAVEGVDQYRRIIGDYDIDRHGRVILHPPQPFVAQQPA